MANYEYIIAGLDVLSPEWHYSGNDSFDSVVGEIRSQLSERDNALVDFLLRGGTEEGADAEFYRSALSHRNRFIREYFRFDLNLRNAKVRFLNSALGRNADMDVLTGAAAEDDSRADLDGKLFDSGTFEEEGRPAQLFALTDLLARERELDSLRWDKIDEITVFDDFDIERILGFIEKLRIVDRWIVLDETEGRERFKKLISEVRGTFGGVNYKEEQ